MVAAAAKESSKRLKGDKSSSNSSKNNSKAAQKSQRTLLQLPLSRMRHPAVTATAQGGQGDDRAHFAEAKEKSE